VATDHQSAIYVLPSGSRGMCRRRPSRNASARSHFIVTLPAPTKEITRWRTSKVSGLSGKETVCDSPLRSSRQLACRILLLRYCSRRQSVRTRGGVSLAEATGSKISGTCRSPIFTRPMIPFSPWISAITVVFGGGGFSGCTEAAYSSAFILPRFAESPYREVGDECADCSQKLRGVPRAAPQAKCKMPPA